VSALIGWGGNVDLGEEENLSENIAWGKRLNETALDMAGGLWMAHAGIAPEDEDSPRFKRFHDSLAEIAAHGESIGAVLALETGPEPPRVVKQLMDSIDSASLRVNFDPANLLLWPPNIAKAHGVPFDYEAAMSDFDPVEGLRTLIPYVVHAHAKDSVLREDGTCEEVPLGTGMTNWPVLHEIFQENGYTGFYAIERECGDSCAALNRNDLGLPRGVADRLGAPGHDLPNCEGCAPRRAEPLAPPRTKGDTYHAQPSDGPTAPDVCLLRRLRTP